MKYLKLFEQFEEGHKFDLLDLYLMDLREVKKLFWKELYKETPDLENIQVLLDSGLVDLEAKNNEGSTPLHRAAWNNSLAVIELLISSGADLEAKGYNGWTPLHFAAMDNRLEVAELLISSGAEVNAKSNGGFTPLRYATVNYHQEMKELLKSHGGVQ